MTDSYSDGASGTSTRDWRERRPGTLVLDTAPTVEPITVAEAIRHLRITEASGEPAPSAPTCALASPAVAGNVDNGVHRYLVTFVTAVGHTAAGDISDTVTVADKTVNGKVTLTNIPIGSSAVTSRNLYRTIASGSSYLLLATIADNTTTSYTDNIADSSLGAGAPSTNTTDDTYITSLIKSARTRIETETGRALCTQSWDYILDAFPCGNDPIVLPLPPVSAVDSITYLDTAGATQTLASSHYVVDDTDVTCRVSLAYGYYWPATLPRANAVTVNFTTGYGAAAAVPDGIKAAMRMAMLGLYVANNAGSNLTAPTQDEIALALQPFIVRTIA